MRVKWEDESARWEVEYELRKRFGYNYTQEQVDSVAEELEIKKRQYREGEVVGCVSIKDKSCFVIRMDNNFFETVETNECTAI